MTELIVRMVHFVALISLSSLLVTQNLLISKQLEQRWLRKLVVIDGLYGLSALIVLASGLTLWLWVGKPSYFYSENLIFQLKLTLFMLVALLSAVPTAFFIRNRKNSAPTVDVPSWALRIKRLEIGILLAIPILAVLMARGVGL